MEDQTAMAKYIQFEVPDEHFIVSSVSCIRTVDQDGKYHTFTHKGEDTDPLTAAQMGQVIHDFFHYPLMQLLFKKARDVE